MNEPLNILRWRRALYEARENWQAYLDEEPVSRDEQEWAAADRQALEQQASGVQGAA